MTVITASRLALRSRCCQLSSIGGTSQKLVSSTYIERTTSTRAFSTTSSLLLTKREKSRVTDHPQNGEHCNKSEPLSNTISVRKMSSGPMKKDWSAVQYLEFNNERTRPVYDLVSQIAPHIATSNPRIYDLGCGPGNSTKVLLDAFPDATITGVDSSPDMLSNASASLPDVEFTQADLATFAPRETEKINLLFSNAVFHWLRSSTRIPTLTRLFQNLGPGGVLAIQMPDNYHEPSHALMRNVALMEDSAWYSYFADAKIGDRGVEDRPDLDPIESPHTFYNALVPHAASINLWRTEYQHVLKDAKAIVEWVKGTGLQPFLQRIEDEEAKKAFLKEYERRLAEAYERLADGKVLLAYPRRFILAVRK